MIAGHGPPVVTSLAARLLPVASPCLNHVGDAGSASRGRQWQLLRGSRRKKETSGRGGPRPLRLRIQAIAARLSRLPYISPCRGGHGPPVCFPPPPLSESRRGRGLRVPGPPMAAPTGITPSKKETPGRGGPRPLHLRIQTIAARLSRLPYTSPCRGGHRPPACFPSHPPCLNHVGDAGSASWGRQWQPLQGSRRRKRNFRNEKARGHFW